MFVEEAVPSSNRSLAVTLRVPSKTNTRGRIEELILHASVGNTVYTAADNAIDDTRIRIVQIERNWCTCAARAVYKLSRNRVYTNLRGQSWVKGRRVPVICIVVLLLKQAKEA